jgi:hypothetical protein
MMTSGIERWAFGVGVQVSPVLLQFFRPWPTMTFNSSDGDLQMLRHSTGKSSACKRRQFDLEEFDVFELCLDRRLDAFFELKGD